MGKANQPARSTIDVNRRRRRSSRSGVGVGVGTRTRTGGGRSSLIRFGAGSSRVHFVPPPDRAVVGGSKDRAGQVRDTPSRKEETSKHITRTCDECNAWADSESSAYVPSVEWHCGLPYRRLAFLVAQPENTQVFASSRSVGVTS
jgi:hypothetical protein